MREVSSNLSDNTDNHFLNNNPNNIVLKDSKLPKPPSVYQVYVRSFKDSNGDGIGDFEGVTQKLDYIKSLGVTDIWLTPFYKSSGADGGYDIVDYKSIDPTYGDKEAFEKLVREAKSRGLNIMIDLVFNHVSIQNELFQRALNGDKEAQDCFFFRKGKGINTPPNALRSKFGVSAWQYVKELDMYYLHLFAKEQADLNWDNPKVQDMLQDVVNYWKSLGITHFRLDVINFISKGDVTVEVNSENERSVYTDGPNIHKYLKEFRKRCTQDGVPIYLIGELASPSLENAVKYVDPKNEELDGAFVFHHLKTDYKDGKKFHVKENDIICQKGIINKFLSAVSKVAGNFYLVFDNHDQPRSVSRFGDDKKYRYESATAINAKQILMRNAVSIYQGQEIGMTNVDFSKVPFDDVESKNAIKALISEGYSEDEAREMVSFHSRDNSRTTFQWDDSPNGGFGDYDPKDVKDTQSVIAPKTNPNYLTINLKADQASEKSISRDTSKLIHLKNHSDLFSYGEQEILYSDSNKLTAFKRSYGSEEAIVLVNETNEDLTLKLDLSEYKVLYTNYKESEQMTYGKKPTLKPRQVLVLYKNNE